MGKRRLDLEWVPNPFEYNRSGNRSPGKPNACIFCNTGEAENENPAAV
jgi:hypothetical protein